MPSNSFLEILPDSNNGKKAYVEQTRIDPQYGFTGALKNVATVEVTLACVIPNGLQGTVNLQWFDPDNPIGSTITPLGYGSGTHDNHGTISSLTPSTLIFNQTTGKYNSASFTISSGYAGDNYVVAAHPNISVLALAQVLTVIDDYSIESCDVVVPTSYSGGNASGGSGGSACFSLDKTPVLTVWRTLWVERDVMCYEDGNYIQCAPVPDINGLVSSEMSRACISICDYPSNTSEYVLGVQTVVFENNQYLFPTPTLARDSVMPTPDFWTIRLVGSFNTTRTGVLGAHGNDSAFIFNTQIDYIVNQYNVTYSASTGIWVDQGIARRRTLLHEIGHAFNLGHGTEGVMFSENSLLTFGSRFTDTNLSFTIDNLKTIQSQLLPV